MRSIRAFKLAVQEPVHAVIRPTRNGVFYRIDLVDEVETPNGLMKAVKLRQKWDLTDPSADVAALVGTFEVPKRVVQPQLWLWDDKFWANGYDQGGIEAYYRNSTYMLYEVKVANEDAIYQYLKLL